ncbi:MAG: response regulator [Rhodoblastus sp.]
MRIAMLSGAREIAQDENWAENERQMAVNRLVITTILYATVTVFGREQDSIGSGFMAGAYLTYITLAAGFCLHVWLWPAPRIWRRVAIMMADICALTYVAYYSGPDYVGLLYPGYLLIIYGFGFRYGGNWILPAGALSILAVSFVAFNSPMWVGKDLLTGGLIVGLAITPAYALNLVRNLWQAKARAEDSSRAKSMFVAAVSHDLRTPLNAIIGLGDVLAASKLPREEADMARMIGQAGRSLLDQINSILDFSRLEMNGQTVSREPVDLLAILRSARELLDISAQAKGVRLLLRVDMPTPRWIVSNARHIRDSLVNLVGNAIKFTPSGHVEIIVRGARVSGGRWRLRFEVRDSGIGMDADEQARIFDRFTQANDGIRETYGGSGLGLAIAKQLVAGLGGKIGVSSVKGEGSVFWFELETESAPNQGPAFDPPQNAILVGADRNIVARARSLGMPLTLARTLGNTEDEAAPDAHAAGLSQEAGLAIVDLRMHANGLTMEQRQEQIQAAGRRNVIFIVDDQTAIDLKFREAGCSATMRWPFDAGALADAIVAVSGVKAATPAHIERAPGPARDLAILVAEDNKTNQKVIAKMLSLVGRSVTIVDDGHAALDILATQRFDVVLMDINMPHLNGIEATRRLRAFERTLDRRTPVIALTADVTDETRTRCKEAGIDDCITKPIDLPALLGAIDRLLEIDSSVVASSEQKAHADDADTPPQADESPEATAPDAAVHDHINKAALADLERLGGSDFVREVVSQFVADAALILKELAAAARDGDVERFRDEAHALRSCSANVGAKSIYHLCLSWRQIEADEVATEGQAHVRTLEQEYEKARAGLAPYLDKAA